MASLKEADGVGGLSDGNHEDAPGQEEFEELLHSNVLDNLVDFDFSCADLSGTDVEARAVMASTSPKLSARKRSFPQTCAWENMAPKALTELSAGLLAGVWDNPSLSATTALLAGGPSATATSSSSSSSAHCSEALNGDATRRAGHAATGPVGGALPTEFADPAAAQVTICEEHGGKAGSAAAAAARSGGGGGKKGCRGKRGGEGGGVAKRPLNPDRMERKATREKRRREEVNQKFEQLLQVLEEAEATSGLEPPPAADGQAGNACINGRRVEVLSRTITVVKKLLRDRRVSSLPSSSSSSSPPPPAAGDAALLLSPLELDPSCLEGDNSSPVSDCALVVSDAPATAVTAAVTAMTAAGPSGSPPAEPAAVTPQAAATVATDATAAPTMHMAMPMHGAHPSMVVPSGFAGMPAAAMSAAAAAGMHHHHHGAPGQPIFIAVPVYMQGQGMGSAEGVAAAPAEGAASMLPQAPLPAVADATASSSPAVVAPGGPVSKPGAGGVGKEAWALPPGMGLQSMMTLQMPHFVTQALSTEEGDEKPTHAVCA